MRWIYLIPLFVAWSTLLPAQDSWTLERCISTGLNTNLSIRLADLNVESAVLEQRRWTYAMLPNVNAVLSGGYQFGRTIDPTSNTFIESTTTFGNGQMNAALVLFDGFRIRNSRTQAKFTALASESTAEDIRNNTVLQIATAYINILYAEEQLETVLRQRDLSQKQLEQIERLVTVGTRPDNERLALVSQLAQSNYQVILQQNGVEQAYLALKQLLLLDPSTPMRIERPSFNPEELEDPLNLSSQALYYHALGTQPVIKAAELQEKSASLSEDIAQAGLIPSLRLFGGLSSAYSNNFLDFANPDLSNVTVVAGPGVPVLIDGELKTLTTYSYEGINYNALSFSDQINRNFGKSFGLNLQIPIYNNHTARIGMQQARIGYEQAQINTEQVRQQLKSTIESALQNARAARQQYFSAREARLAQSASLDALNRRFELGAANAIELAVAKTNLDVAENQIVIAKYEYLFRMKVLDFYLGKPLTLN